MPSCSWTHQMRILSATSSVLKAVRNHKEPGLEGKELDKSEKFNAWWRHFGSGAQNGLGSHHDVAAGCPPTGSVSCTELCLKDHKESLDVTIVC